MFAAGPLDQRVTFERATESRDADFGAVTKVWATLATVWAAVEPLSGREYLRNLEMGSELTVRLRVRYSSALATLNPKDRVQVNGRTLAIVAVMQPLTAGVELQVMCADYRQDG